MRASAHASAHEAGKTFHGPTAQTQGLHEADARLLPANDTLHGHAAVLRREQAEHSQRHPLHLLNVNVLAVILCKV